VKTSEICNVAMKAFEGFVGISTGGKKFDMHIGYDVFL
jgi:hypothetical protein